MQRVDRKGHQLSLSVMTLALPIVSSSSNLQAQSLCLPSASQLHSGAMATWTSPDGTHRHRIDYVAVPQNWSASCAHSSVIQDFDQGNAHEDHQAVGLELCWHGVAETEPRRATGASFHRAAIGPNCNRIACAEIKPASWSTDIETQAQQLNTQLLQQVCLACPVYPAAPKKRCLNGAVWALRAQKLALRKRIRQAPTVSSNTRLRLSFHLWKFPATAAQTIVQHQACEHTNLCIQIRLQCQYLYSLAGCGGTCDSPKRMHCKMKLQLSPKMRLLG